jgi:hypothetical protein
MRPVKMEAVLRAHGFLRIERPPLLWDADVDDEPFFRLLGEMIAAGLVRNGGELSEVVLNVANVTVDPTAAEGSLPLGDFVAVTIRSRGDWGPEVAGQPGGGRSQPLVSSDIEAAAIEAGIPYGYSRVLAGGEGSVTVFLPRASPPRASGATSDARSPARR